MSEILSISGAFVLWRIRGIFVSMMEESKTRLPELDIVKGVAIIAMIICHTVCYMGAVPGHTGYVVAEEILGGPMAAPMFMICMGIAINFSRRSEPLALVKRGVRLFLLAYLLNFLRAGLPFGIGFALGMADTVADMLVMAFLIVDILQFAGLALIFIGLCLRLKINGWLMLAIAVVCSVAGSLCRGFECGSDALNALLGLFIGAGPSDIENCYSCVPFAHWIVYPVFGLLAGRYLKNCKDKERLYRHVLAVSFPITIFYCWLVAKKGFTPLSDGLYYWHSLADGFFFICLDLMLIAIAWQLCKILPQWIIRLLEGLSKNITAVYCISWVIICWVGIPLFMGLELQPLNPWVAYIPALAITAISYWLALKWKARKTSLRK